MTKMRKMGWMSDASLLKEWTYEVFKDSEKDFLLGCGSVSTWTSVTGRRWTRRRTLGTSCDPDDESDKVEAEGTEDLDPKRFEERVLEVGIGRSHQDLGSLHHDVYEGRDNDDGDALIISWYTPERRMEHTWRTLPARKTSWEVPSENMPSSPVTSAEVPPATNHSPPICMRTDD
jgi:hypothetical protein